MGDLPKLHDVSRGVGFGLDVEALAHWLTEVADSGLADSPTAQRLCGAANRLLDVADFLADLDETEKLSELLKNHAGDARRRRAEKEREELLSRLQEIDADLSDYERLRDEKDEIENRLRSIAP